MQRNRENLPNGSKAEECEILSYPKHCSKKAEGGGLEITEVVETNGHSVMCSVVNKGWKWLWNEQDEKTGTQGDERSGRGCSLKGGRQLTWWRLMLRIQRASRASLGIKVPHDEHRATKQKTAVLCSPAYNPGRRSSVDFVMTWSFRCSQSSVQGES